MLGDPTGGRALKKRLDRMRHALDAMHIRLAPEQRQAVFNLAVFGFIPNWFFAASLWLRELDERSRGAEALRGS